MTLVRSASMFIHNGTWITSASDNRLLNFIFNLCKSVASVSSVFYSSLNNLKQDIMKRIHLILIVFATLSTLTSCKKVLDLTSPNDVSDNTVFTSVSGLRNARIGMYNTLQDKNYYGGYYPFNGRMLY